MKPLNRQQSVKGYCDQTFRKSHMRRLAQQKKRSSIKPVEVGGEWFYFIVCPAGSHRLVSRNQARLAFEGSAL